MAALTRFSHLTADTIVNGGATSHLAPTDPADRKLILVAGPGCVTLSHTGVFTVYRGQGFALGRRPGHVGTFSRTLGKGSPHKPSLTPTGLIDTCRECGARALKLTGQLQDRTMLPRAQPSLMRAPLQGLLQLGQVRCASKEECGLKWG